MKSSFKHAIIAGLMATTGLAAFAQGVGGPMMGGPGGGPMGGEPGMHHMMGMHQRDPAKMQAHVAKRLEQLKAKLKITADQEAAWGTFSAAMQPKAQPQERPNWKEIQAMTTPERIDKMRAMRAVHQAEMDKRADAIKAFYGALTPEQKKTFDAQHLRQGPGGRRGMKE